MPGHTENPFRTEYMNTYHNIDIDIIYVELLLISRNMVYDEMFCVYLLRVKEKLPFNISI